MELTYKIKENGYEIYLNGEIWITQYEPYIPNPSISYEENAKAQIIDLTRTDESETESKTEMELALERIASLEQSNAELTTLIATMTAPTV